MSTAMRAPLPAQTRPTIEIFRLEVGGGGSLAPRRGRRGAGHLHRLRAKEKNSTIPLRGLPFRVVGNCRAPRRVILLNNGDDKLRHRPTRFGTPREPRPRGRPLSGTTGTIRARTAARRWCRRSARKTKRARAARRDGSHFNTPHTIYFWRYLGG